jgi:hypothetical protein
MEGGGSSRWCLPIFNYSIDANDFSVRCHGNTSFTVLLMFISSGEVCVVVKAKLHVGKNPNNSQ